MASSEDNHTDGNMGGFQPASGVTVEMSSGSMFNNKSFGSGWDPLDNFGGSPMVVGPEYGVGSSAYPVGFENHQGLLQHYQSGSGSGTGSASGLGDLLPKLGSFGSGSFSEMVNPFGNLNPECGSQRVSEENNNASSPNRREKRRAPPPPTHTQFNPIKNGEGEQRNDVSGDGSENMIEQDDKKRKTEHGKQMVKQANDSSDGGGAPKDSYIHVRAKRGQATNSHSLAERVRRERISERMKLLQELVPGCNKITGKAVMLDEIINYVQSLQQQVEFLSMKLATVNPELNIDIDRILSSKDILHSRGSNPNPAILGFVPGNGPYTQGSLHNIPTTATATPFHPIHPQPVWDNDLHNLLQMGFDSNSNSNAGTNNLGPSGRSKLDL